MAAAIQNLLQQLNGSVQNASTGNNGSSGNNGSNAISSLNSSFQNLVSSLDATQGQGATATNTPTLQNFLQNLLQNIGNVQNSSGSMVSTLA